MNKITKLIKETHIIEFLMVAFVVLTLDLIFIFRYGFGVSLGHMLIAFFNVTLVLSIISFIKKNKRRYIAYFIYILIMLTFFVTDSTLYYFKQDVTSIAMLLESGKNTMKIGLKYNPLSAYNFVVWISIFVFIFFSVRTLYKVVKMQDESMPKRTMKSWVYTLVAVIGLSLSLQTISEEDALTFDTAADKGLFVQKFGSINYHMKDIVTFTSNIFKPMIQRDNYVQQINEILTDDIAEQSPFYGLLASKNVIMIMCETCEDYAFSRTYTPNYYRLKDQSLVFTDFYVAAKTDYTYDAEFKSLTSMMYFQADNYMYSRATNFYPTALPNMLKNNGYSVNSYHNFNKEFFNRHIMHESFGFDRYLALEDLDIEITDDWALDSIMFEQFKDEIAPLQEQPFYSFIITVTPHGPHNYIRENLLPYYEMLDQDPNYVDETIEFRTITAAQMDFDKGLGILLDDLEAKNLMDDTIILIYSDHKNYSSLPITFEHTPNSDIPYEVDKLPFILYAKELGHQEVDILSSHYDITPTLLDLLGIPFYRDLYYGQSIFLENRIDKPIILSHSNWITLTHLVRFDEVVSGTLSPEAFIKIKLEIYGTIELFEMIMFSNYYAMDDRFFEIPEIHTQNDA